MPATACFMCEMPEEMIIRVLEELDLSDLLGCSMTCRLLHDTVKNSVLLQYHIQLALAGMDDCGTASSLTIADRLVEIKTQQESWSTLRFRKKQVFPLPHNIRVWDLLGGVMGHGLPVGPALRGLKFIELPSAARGTSARTWDLVDIGVPIRDFAFEPAQNLLVVVVKMSPFYPQIPGRWQHEVHLFTMNSGKAHPLAASPILRCTSKHDITRRFQSDLVIQVMADFVAVLFHARGFVCQEQLFIWHWKSGRLVTDYMYKDHSKMDSFTFLSPRHFVLSKIHPIRTPHGPALEVYDFIDTHPRGTTSPRLLRSFEFPEQVEGGFVMSLTTRSEPSPRCSSRLPNQYGKPFTTASSLAHILVVSICIFQQPTPEREFEPVLFVLFVHLSTLLEGLEFGHPAALDVSVPWHMWGPQKSRMLLTENTEDSWVCYVHGTRYVRCDFEARRSRVRMLDFNPLLIRQGLTAQLLREEEISDSSPKGSENPAARKDTLPAKTSTSSECKIFSATHPTLIPGGQGFRHAIETRLPYRDIRSMGVFDYDAVMIDEECVVGICNPTIGGDRTVEVLCF